MKNTPVDAGICFDNLPKPAKELFLLPQKGSRKVGWLNMIAAKDKDEYTEADELENYVLPTLLA